MRFLKINVGGNWAYHDMLDGEKLVDGEELLIRFPDRTKEAHKITVVKTVEEVSDMGVPYPVTTTQAFIDIDYHGAKTKIRIKGLYAKRVNIGT